MERGVWGWTQAERVLGSDCVIPPSLLLGVPTCSDFAAEVGYGSVGNGVSEPAST